MKARVLAPLLLLAAPACMDNNTSPTGPRLTVAVAPLDLEGIADACYSVRVLNRPVSGLGTAGTVWSRTNVCSVQFGNNSGDVTYIGTCDASDQNLTLAGIQNTNTVELVIENICTGLCSTPANRLADPADYRNPCPTTAPCRLERPCNENADVLVEFNLTLLRSAVQGFFDIAVNFEDIFCSAKFDCSDEPGLLFDPADVDAGRQLTFIGAVVCTAGVGSAGITATNLYLSDLSIQCSNPVASITTVPLPIALGNKIPNGTPAPAAYPGYTQFAAYAGVEQLVDGALPVGAVYYNYAFAPDLDELLAGGICTLKGRATAHGGEFDVAWTSPAETTYPVIDFNVPLTIDSDLVAVGVQAAVNCVASPLNGANVTTDYTDVLTPEMFDLLVVPNGPNSVAITHR